MVYVARGLALVMAAALFIVTVQLTVDLLSQILPAKYWYLPWLGAGAFDVGVIAWLLTLRYNVHNDLQRAIAGFMLFLDFIGIAVTSIADVFFYDAARGFFTSMEADQIRTMVIALMIVILANVLAWIGMHLSAPAVAVGSAPASRVVVREVKPRVAAKPAPVTPKALPAPSPKPAIDDQELLEFRRWKKQQAANTAKPAQPVKATTAKVAQTAVIDEVEEIVDQAEVSLTSDEVEEIPTGDSENIESDEDQAFDEVEDDEEFDENRAETEEIAVINVAPAKEAVPANAPFFQRLAEAVQEFRSPGHQQTRGPKKLKRIK